VLPVTFRNPALAAFTNAVWHCSCAAEVIWKLNEVATPAAAPPQSPAELLGRYCELIERHPTSVLDSSRLPASKQKMKVAIKQMWQREPKLRDLLAQMYVYLSHFEDGIGDTEHGCKLPISEVPLAAAVHNLEGRGEKAKEIAGTRGKDSRWATSEKALSEKEILTQEWATFVREHDLNNRAPRSS